MQATQRQRPGGRSARVRAGVPAAVLAILAEDPVGALTMVMVAERSGVHHATIYRWESLGGVLNDMVAELVATTAAIPDTGSPRGELGAIAAGDPHGHRLPVSHRDEHPHERGARRTTSAVPPLCAGIAPPPASAAWPDSGRDKARRATALAGGPSSPCRREAQAWLEGLSDVLREPQPVTRRAQLSELDAPAGIVFDAVGEHDLARLDASSLIADIEGAVMG